MRGLHLTIALLAMLSAAAAADGSEKILGGADEKPSLLRKFHVHYKMPQTFVDVPQDSAGAGLSSYGGVPRAFLMVCLLIFSVSHFLPHFQSVGGDQLGASEEEGDFADYDDAEDDFADYDNQWDVEAVEVEGGQGAVEQVPAVSVSAIPAEAAVEAEAEAPAAPALDQASCVLLAQNDMFADADVAARLAEQCWRAEKRARIQQRAAELLRIRRSKNYDGIHSTLEADTFEVLTGTANVGPRFVTGTPWTTPETSPGTSPGSSPTKAKLSAKARPFRMGAENTPPPASWSLLDVSGAPTEEFLRQQSRRRGAHGHSTFDKKGAKGGGLLGAAAPLALVALAVVPSMNSSARRKLAGGSHKGAGHLTAFPTNQHKKPRRADNNAECFPWQGAYPVVRRYDVIRSS